MGFLRLSVTGDQMIVGVCTRLAIKFTDGKLGKFSALVSLEEGQN